MEKRRMTTSILQFKDNAPIRMQVIKGEPWFVAKDICEILDISKYRDVVARLDDDEKGYPMVVDTLGGKQEMTTVNESGLYAVIFQSRKPEAKAFLKWVTSEVLPCLRKNGSYAAPGSKERLQLEAKTERKKRHMWLAELRDHLTYTDHEMVARKLHVSSTRIRMVLSGHEKDTAIEAELAIYAARKAKLGSMLDDSEWREEFMGKYLKNI